jgi:uncharacterized protein
MSSEPNFRVAVRDLPAHKKVEVGSDYVGRVLAGMPMREALGADVEAGGATLDAELYSEGENVHASGRIKGEVVVACSRCVGAAHIPLDEPINVTWMLQSAITPDDDEGDAVTTENPAAGAEGEEGVELGAEDLDVFPYDGERVDLEPLIREQLVLAVPYAPLCREDCRGLCPQCGIDRNVATCTCEKPIDPRFEALKGLKLKS